MYFLINISFLRLYRVREGWKSTWKIFPWLFLTMSTLPLLTMILYTLDILDQLRYRLIYSNRNNEENSSLISGELVLPWIGETVSFHLDQ